MTQSRVVTATGVAVGHNGTPEGQTRAKFVEAAMSKAVTDALAENITDPDEQRRRILEARDKAQAEYYAPLTAE